MTNPIKTCIAATALLGLSFAATAQDESEPPTKPQFNIVEETPPNLIDVPLPADLRREPEPIEGIPLFNDGAGILNPHFQKVVNGVPLHWYVVEDRKDRIARGIENRSEDTYHIVLRGEYPYNYIRQVVELDGPLAGKTVVFSVEVKIGNNGAAKIALVINYDNNAREDSPDHPGTGDWEVMEIAHTVPDDFTGGVIDVGVVHYLDPTELCLVRNPKIEVRP